MNFLSEALLDITIRHYEENDIEAFYKICRRPEYQSFISNFALIHPKSNVFAHERDVIQNQFWNTRRFVLTRRGDIIAIAWILLHDIPGRIYELLIASDPAHRFGLGYFSMIKMFDFMFYEMNAAVVLGRIAHDNSMVSAKRTRSAMKEGTRRPSFSHMGSGAKDILEWTFNRDDYENFKKHRESEWLERSQRLKAQQQ